jgi:hypothetical protein
MFISYKRHEKCHVTNDQFGAFTSAPDQIGYFDNNCIAGESTVDNNKINNTKEQITTII